MQTILLTSFVFLCCCTPSQKQAEQKGYTSDAKGQNEGEKVSGTELRKLYEAANSEHEHRAVCLRAIDEGLIRHGGPVSIIDEIFGTHFASELPNGNEVISNDLILFASQPSPPPRSDGRAAGMDYVGWYMAFDYDQKGDIQNYYLTNLHKGYGSPFVDGKPSSDELRRLYETTQSEVDRRAACLRAIDEGAIRTYHPVSAVDEIFGTHFASDLPSRKESIRKANIEFAPPAPNRDNPKIAERSNWFLAIEYDYQGTLLNYSLTNIKK